MGVKGLWKIISGSGKPIPVESLENKTLAVDVSIWLHQAVHGMRGLGGSSVANAHLLVLFHRICKLLFYGIKPIFVFDGGVPRLKKQTLAARRLKREIASKNANRVRERLLSNLLKSQAVRKALGKRGPGPSQHHIVQLKSTNKDMFELPPLPVESTLEQLPDKMLRNETDVIFTSLHDYDYDNETFKSLSLQTKHELMCDLEITRKENSWNAINEMPQESNSFAEYQMERLLKRKKFQVDLDTVRLQIQKGHTAELEAQLFEELEEHVSLTHRIISEDAHSIIVKNRKAEEPAKNIFSEEEIVKPHVAVTKYDFLTELTRQGIVDQDKLNDNYESDSELSDEEQWSFRNQSRQEQASFIKALDCVLDSGTELSQEEIYSLIQQSRQDVVTDNPKILDVSKPSTSKQSDMWQACSSSDDDDDFIEVPEPDSDTNVSPIKSSNVNEPFKTNIDAIRQSKSSSLFLKIIQQKLDDMKPDISSTDSRQKLSPEKSDPPGGIKISFDINSCKPLMEDIFSDVFSTPHSTLRVVDKEMAQNTDIIHNSTATKQTHPADSNKSTSRYVLKQKHTVAPYKAKSSINLKDYNIISTPILSTDVADTTSVQIINKGNRKPVTVGLPALKSVIENLDSDNDGNSLVFQNDSSDGVQVNFGRPSAFHTPKKTGDCNNLAVDTDILHNSVDVSSNYTVSEPVVTCETAGVSDTGHVSHSETNIKHFGNSTDTTINTPSENLTVESHSNASIPRPQKYSEVDLINLEMNLAVEQKSLVSEMQNMDRIASSMSEQKFKESQELLKLFGIPYIVAPMEAEAQCAFLNSINLTQGTITDDSDIFLFGGKHVYKNFFNQMKHVEMFDSRNIREVYGLTRMKMIQLALLTGSDYTIGIDSVGAVLAMELLSEFPADDLEGLVKMKRNWNSLKNSDHISSGNRSKLCNLRLPECFPNQQISEAYLNPEVDTCNDKFRWGLLNVDALTKFTADKFGWNVSKTSDILIPVLKKIDHKSSQRRLDSYFNRITLTKEPQIKSKRLLEAIKISKAEQSLPNADNIARTQSNRKAILIPDPPRPSDPKPAKRKKSQTCGTAPGKKPKSEGNCGMEISESDATVLVKPLTKEEKKQKNFESLLKKPKIPQVEKEKLEKTIRLQNAIKILSKNKQPL